MIETVVGRHVEDERGMCLYRQPIIGSACADDPLFDELSDITHFAHLHPRDLLSEAESVVAFFLPFAEEIVQDNRRGNLATRLWAEVYTETNRRIDRIQRHIREFLLEEGIRCEFCFATGSFDTQLLMAEWSHKHVACVCGLGTFGMNNLLITERGCAGRLGSVVLDVPIESSGRPQREYCLHKRGFECRECSNLCPVDALSGDIFNRHRCYTQLLQAEEKYNEFPAAAVCGKCSLGKCSLGIPQPDRTT